jgi:hypothetical protein
MSMKGMSAITAGRTVNSQRGVGTIAGTSLGVNRVIEVITSSL